MMKRLTEKPRVSDSAVIGGVSDEYNYLSLTQYEARMLDVEIVDRAVLFSLEKEGLTFESRKREDPNRFKYKYHFNDNGHPYILYIELEKVNGISVLKLHIQNQWPF